MSQGHVLKITLSTRMLCGHETKTLCKSNTETRKLQPQTKLLLIAFADLFFHFFSFQSGNRKSSFSWSWKKNK